MRQALLAATLVATGVSASLIAPGPWPEFDWVAMPEVGGPDLVNPAGYAELPGPALEVSFFTSDSSFEKIDRVALHASGGGWSGWWDDSQSMRRFSTGLGFRSFGERLSLGLGYTWFDPTVADHPWEDKGFFSFGLLARPGRNVSVGIAHDLGTEVMGETEGRRYAAGLGLRPFRTDLVTLLVNGSAETVWEDATYSFGLDLRPLPGLSVRADVTDEGAFNAGLALEFGMAGISFAGSGTDDDAFTGSRGHLAIAAYPMENLLGAPSRILRLSPGEVGEEPEGGLFSEERPSFTEFASIVRTAASDPSVEGFLVEIRHGPGNPAQAEEIRGILEEAKSSGKPVFAYLESTGNWSYYLASVADRIYMHPGSAVVLPGMSGTGYFARGFLDKIGVYPDLLHIGEYKSASDMLTRYDMSEAQREALHAVLESCQSELRTAVIQGRSMGEDDMNRILEKAVFTSSAALEHGLVDAITYADEVEEHIEEHLQRGVRLGSVECYSASLPVQEIWGPEPHVGVVVATGVIVNGRSGHSPFLGTVMGSETICDLLRSAAAEPGVVALVLRIDSGGGDGLASEDMLHTLYSVRERLPVVVSMGSVAGSGGYYMACGADEIFADDLTITGSIGVILGKFVISDLLSNLGISHESIDISPSAGIGSMLRPYTQDELETMGEVILGAYEDFVQDVADGRGMTVREVDRIARGRIWSGTDALEIGLVDEIGGVVDAVDRAWALAEMPRSEQPVIRVYPEPGLFSGLGGPMGFLGILRDASVSDLVPMDQNSPLFLMAPVDID